MYLSENSALRLKELGFKRTYYVDEIAPFDYYKVNGEEWVTGGRILPQGELLAPSHVYNEGTWLPSLKDLMIWLVDNGYTFTLECKELGYGYAVNALDNKGNTIKGKGGTAELAFCKVIEQILKSTG
ncbi:hypothetical protein Elgi_04400 [Paenibacillus elgii]|uniref:hypothetical protein n=1 Tax=Paenibacillus elgii TaxID=189691 RepID=UPI002D7A68F0|nr:hypothetical protein Elgi_04400 [Paenibacillus elgii]